MSQSRGYFKKPPSKHSKVKTEIVVKYFDAWSKIIGNRENNIIYLDLYAGRGEHYGGELSTALKLIEMASKNQFLK